MLVFTATYSIFADPKEKIVICHANSSGGFTRIEVSPMAQGGHFEENGTTAAGHEDDIFLGVGGGECPTGDTTAVPEPITMLLFGAGLAGVGFVAKRRKQRAE